jgi:Ner family transcriptional regulator
MRCDIPRNQSQNGSRGASASADWPSARIVYQLKLRGLSLRRLAIAEGFKPRSFWNVTRYRWRRAEQIVARALKISPSEIWPSRYPKGRAARRSA